MNLSELLDESAARWPEKAAVIEGEIAISYKALQATTSSLAAQLQRLQLSPSCRIGLCYPNSIDYVALTFALWRMNVVVVPIPTESTEEDFLMIAATMELEGILSQKPLGNSVQIQKNCFFTRAEPAAHADNHGLNIAFIRFTSGTTSARKGVVLCHETIRERIQGGEQGFADHRRGYSHVVFADVPSFFNHNRLIPEPGRDHRHGATCFSAVVSRSCQSLARHHLICRSFSLFDAGARHVAVWNSIGAIGRFDNLRAPRRMFRAIFRSASIARWFKDWESSNLVWSA